jgi:RNA polymerase sigma factor FliA
VLLLPAELTMTFSSPPTHPSANTAPGSPTAEVMTTSLSEAPVALPAPKLNLDTTATPTVKRPKLEATGTSHRRTPEQNQALANLWAQLKREPTNAAVRDRLIMAYLHLVKYVVNRMPVSLPSSVSVEDLISYGTIGLMEAIDRFELERGLKFETYAMTRIRGCIIDQLRQQDWVPRSVRKRSRDMLELSVSMEHALGRSPTDDELATALGVTKQRLKTMQAEANNLVLSLDDTVGHGDGEGQRLSLLDTVEDKLATSPEGAIEGSELQQKLAEAINILPEREKLLVALYYHENLTLKEIGDIINVSESRVCQLHAQAIVRLRKRLHNQLL